MKQWLNDDTSYEGQFYDPLTWSSPGTVFQRTGGWLSPNRCFVPNKKSQSIRRRIELRVWSVPGHCTKLFRPSNLFIFLFLYVGVLISYIFETLTVILAMI